MSAPSDPLAAALAGLSGAPLRRRDALRLLALGLTAGVAGCKPAEDIVPLVANPAGRAAGSPLFFATSLPLAGYGRGVLATSLDGRPIKIAGNGAHPASLGGTDVFAEADILGLYDPDRSQTPLKDGAIRDWEALIGELRPRRAQLAERGGEGLALLTGRVTSPTLLRQIAALRAGPYPKLRHYRHEPVGDDAARAGARFAFGRVLDTLPHLDRAATILCLGADPLGPGPGQIRNAKGFRTRRTVRGEASGMARLHVVESRPSLTGRMADHRLALAPGELAGFAFALAERLSEGAGSMQGPHEGFLAGLAADLQAAGPEALVLVDDGQPPELHALGHWLNHRLGGFGTALDLIEPVDPVPEDHGESLAALGAELDAGRVDTLLVLGANPAYDAPRDQDFGPRLRRAGLALHLGLYRDETAHACHWHVPESHPLEAWGDLRAVDGTAGIVQPLIRPLHVSKTAAELLAALGGDAAPESRALVRDTWAAGRPAEGFEDWWRAVLEAGIVPDSAAPPVAPPRPPPMPPRPPAAPDSGLVLLFEPDPTIFDGRYANNAWLQECPKPVTHEVWGNVLRLAPADAARLGLASEDAVRIEAGGASLDAPVLVDGGMAPGAATLSLGYGRDRAGAIGVGLGVDAYRLRRSDALWQLAGARLTRLGRGEPIPRTQFDLSEEGRDLAPRMPLAERRAGKRLREKAEPPSFYGPQSYEASDRGPGERSAWAMVIDTTLCIGCNACVIACQSENNVPVVGPDEIRAGRMMHWLRIDAYEAPGEPGRATFQPVPCMHCEKAPCEPVCPVGASVHDHEGLNGQVYNRCVGTRFCQANCPYKVRRFNFFGYANGQEYANLGEPPLQALLNPDVTVRGRGVMEKCTYCVQRIAGARQTAEAEGRDIREGEVVTACASACPTEAIRFGDLASAKSEVRALRDEPQHYALLEEVGTRPRTTYLARLLNPNPALEGEGT